MIIVILMAPVAAISQCLNSLQFISYDTTVTGGGNSSYFFRFPKLAAAAGTLVEVRIRAEVTLSYGFELENNGGAVVTGYRVRVDRNDQIISDALQDPIDTTFPRKTYGPFALTPSDGVPSSGSDYYKEPYNHILNHAPIQRTVYNTADYLGTGDVEFEYIASSFTISPTSPPTFATANDTINFRITYVVCPMFSLASDVSYFNARKNDESSISIHWSTVNETIGRKYVLESSSDGRNFEYVDEFRSFVRQNETGNYNYIYKPQPDQNGKIVFRLKLIDKLGKVTYSPMRVVEWNKRRDHATKIYPNPGNGQLNVVLHNQKRGDWTIEIFSIDGQMLQRYFFRNTLVAKLDLRGKLPKGTYVMKTIDRRSEEKSIQKFVIQ